MNDLQKVKQRKEARKRKEGLNELQKVILVQVGLVGRPSDILLGWKGELLLKSTVGSIRSRSYPYIGNHGFSLTTKIGRHKHRNAFIGSQKIGGTFIGSS